MASSCRRSRFGELSQAGWLALGLLHGAAAGAAGPGVRVLCSQRRALLGRRRHSRRRFTPCRPMSGLPPPATSLAATRTGSRRTAPPRTALRCCRSLKAQWRGWCTFRACSTRQEEAPRVGVAAAAALLRRRLHPLLTQACLAVLPPTSSMQPMILKNFPYDSWSLLVQLELQASGGCCAVLRCARCAAVSPCPPRPQPTAECPTAVLPPSSACCLQDTTPASHPGLRLIPSAAGLTPVA